MGYSNIQLMDFTRLIASTWGTVDNPHVKHNGVEGVKLLHNVWQQLKHAG